MDVEYFNSSTLKVASHNAILIIQFTEIFISETYELTYKLICVVIILVHIYINTYITKNTQMHTH